MLMVTSRPGSYSTRPRWAVLPLLLLLALPASEALGAIAFVKNVGTAGNTTTGTTIAVTVPAAGVAANNTIIVTFTMDPAAGTVSVADTRGNAYTSNADITNGSGTSGVRTVILSARVTTALTSGNTITVTFPSVAAKAVSVNEFSGIAAGNVLDRTSTATGTSTAPTSNATAATQQADELLIGAIGAETSTTETFTVGASYTALTRIASGTNGNIANHVTINPEFRIVAATGAYTATGTLGASRLWADAIATYRAAICGNTFLEPGEQCDDGNTANGDCCSSTCAFEAATTVCRASAGTCDVAENCTGTSGTCPANALAAAGTSCRAAVGTCDVAETCTGTSVTCPADAFVAAGTTRNCPTEIDFHGAQPAPSCPELTEQQLDTVVAGWVNPGGQPCGASQWDCGDNGWGDGYDLNNPGSYSGGTAPSKTANGTVYGYGQININPTTSNGR